MPDSFCRSAACLTAYVASSMAGRAPCRLYAAADELRSTAGQAHEECRKEVATGSNYARSVEQTNAMDQSCKACLD